MTLARRLDNQMVNDARDVFDKVGAAVSVSTSCRLKPRRSANSRANLTLIVILTK